MEGERDTHKEQRTLHRFVKNVSIPGSERFLSVSRTRRLCWILVLVCAFFLLSYQLTHVILEYQEFQLDTTLINRENTFLFPDLTICKLKPYSWEKRPPGGLGFQSASRFWQYALNKTRKTIVDEQEVYRMASQSTWEYTYDRDVFTEIRDHLHHCFYKEGVCKREDFRPERQQHSSRRNCVTFAPRERSYGQGGGGRGRRTGEGLQLALSMGKSYLLPNPVEEMQVNLGYELYVHEPNTQFPANADSISIRAWQHVTVSLQLKRYLHTKTPRRDCQSSQELQTFYEAAIRELYEDWNRRSRDAVPAPNCTFERTVTETDCADLVDILWVYRKCGCIDTTRGMPSCHAKTFLSFACHHLPTHFFFNDALSLSNGSLFHENQSYHLPTDHDYKHVLKQYKCWIDANSDSQQESIQEESSRCPSRCKRANYIAITKYNRWPVSREGLRRFLRRMTQEERVFRQMETFSNYSPLLDANESFARLTVFPSDLGVDEVVENIAYPLSKLISDFGGTIGLWVGCSFLTLIELCEFVVLLCVRLCTVATDDRVIKKENGLATRSSQTDGLVVSEEGRRDTIDGVPMEIIA